MFAAVLFLLPMSSNAQEQENKKLTLEVGYDASTFDDVKRSGSYGLSMTGLPWHLTDKLYVGYHFSPFYFNFGLVDSDYTSDVIKFGPALGYYFKPTIFLALPIVAVCDVYFKGTDTKTAWGMAWAPSLYAGGKKIGVFAGPMFTLGFTGETKVNVGFRAGIYF